MKHKCVIDFKEILMVIREEHHIWVNNKKEDTVKDFNDLLLISVYLFGIKEKYNLDGYELMDTYQLYSKYISLNEYLGIDYSVYLHILNYIYDITSLKADDIVSITKFKDDYVYLIRYS
jgi:hypothetical protein